MNHTDSRNLADELERDGYTIWTDFLNPAQGRELRVVADDLLHSPHAQRFPKSTRVFDLYRHHQQFHDLLHHTGLTAMLQTVLGDHFVLSDYSLNRVNPDQPIDDWHIDYPYNDITTPLPTGPILGIQCVLTLDHFTRDNGATTLIPRSHQPPTRPESLNHQAPVTFEAEPGTLLIMAASTHHRSGLNTTNTPRTAALLSYIPQWIKPMADPPEPGPWANTETDNILLGKTRPPQTLNGIIVA